MNFFGWCAPSKTKGANCPYVYVVLSSSGSWLSFFPKKKPNTSMTALLNNSGVDWPFNVVTQRTETKVIVMMLFTSMSFAILSLIFIVSTLKAKAF